MAVANEEAQELARRISEHFHPDRVILFGSQARGSANDDSDLDLLVVMDCTGPPIEQAVAIREYLHYYRPLDLLVRTPAELERRLALGDWFLRDVMAEGVVLYERPRP